MDPEYVDLADEGTARHERYARFVEQGVPQQELTLMREASQRSRVTGHQRFVGEVEQIIGVPIERRRPGRPSSRRTRENRSVPVFSFWRVTERFLV